MDQWPYWYTYDAEGNRTARFVDQDQDGQLDAGDTDVSEYRWDARNRLVEVTTRAAFGGTPTQVVDYLYDAENRWIGESIDGNGDGQIDREIRFAYDGNQIVLQFEKSVSPLPPEEGQGGDPALTVADLSHRYLWQPNAVDQLMADEQFSPLPPGEGQSAGSGYHSQPGNVVWSLADNLGTIRDLATFDSQTAATSVVDHRVYDSFGNLQSQTNATADSLFGFTGRPLDKASGLQNNLNRWYEAKTGNWLCNDPLGFAAGDANTVQYSGNSPVNATDPTGLRECDDRLTKKTRSLVDVSGILEQEVNRIIEIAWGQEKIIVDEQVENYNHGGSQWRSRNGRVERWRGGVGFDIVWVGVSPVVPQ